MNREQEFTQVHFWTGRDVNGNIYTEKGRFVDIEYKYFEGFNIPFKMDESGNRESFEEANSRIQRWMGLPLDRQCNLRLERKL